MRRRPVSERVEKKTKALTRLLIAQPERLKHPRLYVLPVNSNASGPKLVAVEHQIVSLRAAFPRRGLELIDILFVNSGERVLRAYPAFFVFAPFKKREAGNPGEFPFFAVDQIQCVTEV